MRMRAWTVVVYSTTLAGFTVAGILEERRQASRIVIHSTHGLVALAALLMGTEWIVRRLLLEPVRALSHQVGLMRDGRGWQPHLEAATQELSQLSAALVELGPGLERQVREWIEAERRSAVALILVQLRISLDETQRRALDRLRAIEQLARDSTEDRDLLIAARAAELSRWRNTRAAPCRPG